MSDEDDETRDHMAPPKVPCLCWCLHCHRTFMSDQIWFQKVINDPAGFDGFWMCPTNNCGGAGYTFDIFPVDPNHPDNAGWHTFDDEEEFDEDGEFVPSDREYDPEEEEFDNDGDIEGEEWKYGIDPFAPAEETPRDDSPQREQAQREMEEREKKYDLPDERPRVLDWKDREDRRSIGGGGDAGGFREDDIPF
jgi:hypothetical protein